MAAKRPFQRNLIIKELHKI